ncbi:hypothetical protein ACHAXN_013060 [Cyclotella atomus]
MTTNRTLTLITALLLLPLVEGFLAPSRTIKCLTTQLSSSMPHLYRDEPNPMDSAYIKKEEHDPKHSSFHVEQGHLIDVDHEKLDDLGLKAQNAWKPVNVHEMEVDAVSLTAALFMLLAAVLIGAGFGS